MNTEQLALSKPSAEIDETDYQTVPLAKGQYWIREQEVVAFILELNEYAVIYQARTTLDPDKGESIMDFEYGQEMLLIDEFRSLLEKQRATQVFPGEPLIAECLSVFTSKLVERKILAPKILPRDQDDVDEYITQTHYIQRRSIIPPPKRYRNLRSLHWLRAGVSGTTYVCKMWDPIVDNWVTPAGVDVSAAVGFVKAYDSMVAVLEQEKEIESTDALIQRITTLMRSVGFFFDERHIQIELGKQRSRLSDDPINTATCHRYHLSLRLFESKAILYLSLNHSVVKEIDFGMVENGEFIPNQPVTVNVF